MRRSLPLLVLFLALLIIAAYFYLSDRAGTYRDSDIQFGLGDTAVIDRIVISKEQDRLILDRDPGYWRVNGMHYARSRLVNNLLLSMYRQQADVPVSRKDFDRIHEKLTTGARKVQVFNGEDLLKAYSMYYDMAAGVSYMMLEGSSSPFRIHLPGFSIMDIGSLYSLDEKYWRDKLLFSLPADQIAGLRIDYPDRPCASFRIEKKPDGRWSVISLSDGKELDSHSSEALKRYLTYFSQLRYDDVLAPVDHAGEFVQGEVEAEILLTDTGGNETWLRIIPRYTPDGKMDLDRLYLQLNGKDELMLARYVQIDLILKEISYFTGTDQ